MAFSRNLLVFALMIAAGQAALAPVAAAAPASRPTTQQDEADSDQLLEVYFGQLATGEFAKALTTAEGIRPASDNKPGRGIVAALRGGAMIGLKRDQDAAKLFAEARALAPDVPLVHTLEFLAAYFGGRMDFAGNALDAMIGRAPDVVRGIDPELMWDFLRREPDGQEVRNQNRRVALARIGYGGSDGDQLSYDAVGILLKRGDAAGAADLLQYVDAPRLIEDMLIQKRYAALWPRLEERAGPGLAKVRASDVAAAELAYQETSDSSKLMSLANSLRHARRLAEAIELRIKLPATPAAIAADDEHMGWAINNVALALHEAGRGDDADRLFASLNEARMENAEWRVSMKINRLELLVADGRFQQALPLIALTEESAKTGGSPYAQQLVRRLKYCTMSGLDRKDEAARLLADVLKHAEDAAAPTIDGLLCAGEIDKAEQLALASLKKDGFEGDFVRALQPHPLTSDDPSVWSKGWKALRQRPAILREFNRLGRDLPVTLLPPPKSL